MHQSSQLEKKATLSRASSSRLQKFFPRNIEQEISEAIKLKSLEYRDEECFDKKPWDIDSTKICYFLVSAAEGCIDSFNALKEKSEAKIVNPEVLCAMGIVAKLGVRGADESYLIGKEDKPLKTPDEYFVELQKEDIENLNIAGEAANIFSCDIKAIFGELIAKSSKLKL